MKRLRMLFFVVSLCVFPSLHAQQYLEMIDAGTFSVEEIVAVAEAYFDGKDTGRGSGFTQYKRWEYMANRLQNEQGYISSISENLAELQRYNQYLNNTSQSRHALTDNWQELGPFSKNATTAWSPGVGRITSIAIDPSNANHILVGANTGGVWKTVDGGATWMPLGDTFTNLRVYSVTIDPLNNSIYYFGSSSGLIFKSIDAGGTWTQLADMSSSLINKIVIHPENNAIIFACSQNAGIFRSADAGVSWQHTGIDNNAYDVEFKPGNPDVVYASGNGFHVSVDEGANFTTIPSFNAAPKMIGVSPANPSRVYVLEANGGSFGALYVSNDSGLSFEQRDHNGRNYFGYDTAGFESGGQAPRDMDIAVHPTNADEVHIAGVLTWRSIDGGITFSCTADWVPGAAANANIGYCHADVDLLLFYGSTLFVGSDGGIFKAENTAVVNANYYEDITNGLGIRQFYKIGISQTTNVVVTGGSQDNGTSFYTAANDWIDWIGADGMEGFVDKDNPDTMYGMIQFGGMYRTDDAAINLIGLNNPSTGNWVTPFEQDPLQTNLIYSGYDRVYKSTNKGTSWTAISQVFGGNLNHLKIATSNNQILYAARGTQLYKTTNGGATNWEQVTSPGGGINEIAIHPTNPNKIAIATTTGNKVKVSHDGGGTWENYRFNLPDFSALTVVWHDNGANGLYVGMDYGIYYIDDGLSEWQPFNNNLPNVIINELEIHPTNNEIYAGSYGRGLWVSPAAEASQVLGISHNPLTTSIVLYPNPARTQVTIQSASPLVTDIKIYDASGKLLVFKRDVEILAQLELNIASLKPGIYFIRFNSEMGTATKKLMIK